MGASRLQHGLQLVRHFGLRWVALRAYHALKIKSGILRRQLPVTTWDQQPLAQFLSQRELADPKRYIAYRHDSSPRFLFDPNAAAEYRPLLNRLSSESSSSQSHSGGAETPTASEVAEDVARGIFRFFSHEPVDVGMPPRWHVDPFTGHTFPHDRHWSLIPDFAAGDVKLVWESSRFGFVFALVRAYWKTGDERLAELFWALIESWRAANPPECGPNWKCGQEVSLRVMAWSFGLFGFQASPATTPERLANLAQMMAVSGRRIEAHIGYALNQQNNHGISEAMGLWTIGRLFPEFTDSRRWSDKGRRLLESQARELIYDDGAFSQHSLNYQRVMLHDYLWSIRLGDVQGQPLSDTLRQRVVRSGEFLAGLQDTATGRVPCYGQDDGAFILPLNDCGYRDYRPIVQAVHYLGTGRRRWTDGPWNEDLLWLFGSSALGSEAAAERTPSVAELDAPQGGCHTLRSENGFAFIRAGGFRHRPAQADMLHVDLWWRGENIAVDPGTYSYNAPEPWNNPFAQTCHHNTVTVDGRNQMDKAGRFLWLPWIKGRSQGRLKTATDPISCWQGTHDGYQRLADGVSHRRAVVRLGDDHWLVVDHLAGTKPHEFRLHWLLNDFPCQADSATKQLELQTKAGPYHVAVTSSVPAQWQLQRGDESSPTGWRSTHYHDREPALAVSLTAEADQVLFVSVFGPDRAQVQINANEVVAETPFWSVTLHLEMNSPTVKPLITNIQSTGTLSKTISQTNAKAA